MDIVDIFAYTYCHVMILKLPDYNLESTTLFITYLFFNVLVI